MTADQADVVKTLAEAAGDLWRINKNCKGYGHTFIVFKGGKALSHAEAHEQAMNRVEHALVEYGRAFVLPIEEAVRLKRASEAE